ncbi:MAG: hypothetical protein AAGB46_15545 [Verrucomicrobiota bacterium]
MERDEAKAILELYRPGSIEDAQDPMIAEALGLLQIDADLKAWFDAQQAIDTRISGTYNQVEAQADLKASILAGMRAHASEVESEGFPASEATARHGAERTRTCVDASIPSDEHAPIDIPNSSQSWWRNLWVGFAAGFALLFLLMAIPNKNDGAQVVSDDSPALQAGIPPMIQFLAGEIETSMAESSYAMRSSRPDELQAYLASLNAPMTRNLPALVENKSTYGCFVFDYNGAKMGMMCFRVGGLTHLTTVRKSELNEKLPVAPAIYEFQDQAFKVWTDTEHVNILSIHGSKEELTEFL